MLCNDLMYMWEEHQRAARDYAAEERARVRPPDPIRTVQRAKPHWYPEGFAVCAACQLHLAAA